MNPYKILDIDPSANLQEIKTAYRSKSKMHHPDQGGDAEKFQEINLAYRVLSDPQKRKVYDEQGIIMDESPEHAHNIVKSRVAGIMEAWLENMVRGRKIPMQPFFESNIDQALNEIRTGNANMNKSRKTFKDLRDRISCKSENNMAHSLIDQKLDMIDKAIKQNMNEKDILEALKIAVQDYEFKEEEPVAVAFSATGSEPTGFRWSRF